MRQSLVKFSESEASNHTPSLADFTTTTPELKLSVHTMVGLYTARSIVIKGVYPWRRMRRSRAPGTFFVAQSWADCITNMAGFNLRQAQVFSHVMIGTNDLAKAKAFYDTRHCRGVWFDVNHARRIYLLHQRHRRKGSKTHRPQALYTDLPRATGLHQGRCAGFLVDHGLRQRHRLHDPQSDQSLRAWQRRQPEAKRRRLVHTLRAAG